MRAGSFRRWSLPWSLAGVAACSNIIGISSYEIDPSLDPPDAPPGGERGEPGDGGRANAGEGGTRSAGEGGAGGTSLGGTGAVGAAAGAAGEPPVVHGCQSDLACDDTIDCTLDACLPSGECEHTSSTERCDPSNCEVCTAGIGCVAGPMRTVQLLADPQFDAGTSDWEQDGVALLGKDTRALSSPNLLQLGPAPPGSTETEYADVFQAVTIPKGIAALALTLSYRFTPGARQPSPPDDEYAVVALYQRNALTPFTEFHEFDGTAPAQATWKRATYKAPYAEVSRMVGKSFTFDLVAHALDGVFLFDDLQLDATVCE